MTDSAEVYNFTVATGHDAKCKPQEENGLTHDWSIYVKSAKGTRLDLVVNEVEFKLHESFADPIRTIRTADSSGAYRVGESGYAGFIVHIKVRFMNGACIELKHDLFLYNSRDVNSTTEHSLTFANPTGKFRDALIQSGAKLKDKSPQRSPPLLSDLKYADSKYEKSKEKVRRPDPEARPRLKEDRKSTADKTLDRDKLTDRDNARKDEKRARKEEKRKRREKDDREKKKVPKSVESKSKGEIDLLFDSAIKTESKPRRPESSDKKSEKSEKREKSSKSGRSLEEKQKSFEEKKKKNRDKDREKDRSDRDKDRDKNREKKKIVKELKSNLSKSSVSTSDLQKKIKKELEDKKTEKRKSDDEKRQREKRKSEKMKPETRVEPDAKRTKLAESNLKSLKEPKIEPHDPADEAPRLDRDPKDDKTAALEADKRKRREKEERREEKKRRKEKSSKHEDKPRGDRPPIKLKIPKENIKIEPDPKREKKPKIKDSAGSSSSSSSRRESDIPKREIEKTEIKREYQSSDSIKVEKSEKKQSRPSKRPLPIPGKDLPKDQPISSQSSPATTAELSPAFHTRSPSLAPSIPPSGPDFTPSQPPSSMPSPIGSTENSEFDDDRMSTGHSVHTGSRSTETETRHKPSDRVKGAERDETPKISDSDSGSHTTDDDHSSSDSSDSNASSDDSDSDSDGGKCEEISQDELQEIQQKIMQYLKSTDSKYDKVLANIFNYIFEKEENKLNLDESTCKFDLTSLQAKTQFKIKNFLSNISS